MMPLHEALALFTTITTADPVADIETAREDVAALAAVGELTPALADQLHDHLDRTEAAIRTSNARL